MNVLHSYLFFSIKFAGGTSDLMYKILKAQSKNGQNPVLLTGNYRFDSELFENLSNVEIIKSKSFFDNLGFSIMPFLLIDIKKNRSKFDVVHMHIYRTFQSAILYIFCRLFRIKYIIDAHGAVPYHQNKIFLKKVFDFLIGKRMLKNSHCLVAETEVGKQEYLDICPELNPKNIKVLSPPFDTDEFDPVPTENNFRERFNIPADKKLITFLGRLHYIKGNDFLINGFERLLQTRDDCHLVLVGPDDGHEATLRKMVLEKRLEENVTFTGFMGGKDKNEALVASDIVVQLSRFEQGAWAPMEGVLCGTPIVVTSDTGTGEDVKRLKAGYTVDFDDVKMLSTTFDNILQNYDEALKVTSTARTFIIENLSMNARVGEYYDLFG